MKTIYIAGPYRAESLAEIQHNIFEARIYAEDIWQLGHFAFCPHLNSANMDGLVPDEVFLAAGLLMIEKCDAVYVVHGFRKSKGTLAEIAHATKLGIPVYYSIEKLKEGMK